MDDQDIANLNRLEKYGQIVNGRIRAGFYSHPTKYLHPLGAQIGVDMEEKFDNTTLEELIPYDVSIYGFIERYRIAHDNDPDTPLDKDKPSGPYIPLAIRK